LVIDIAFATGAHRHTGDHFEHVRWAWSGAHRAKEDLDLAVQLVDSLVELDVPAAKFGSAGNAGSRRAEPTGPSK